MKKLTLILLVISGTFILSVFNVSAAKYNCIYTTKMAGYKNNGAVDGVSPIIVDVLGKKFTAQRPAGQELISPELIYEFDGFYVIYTDTAQYRMSFDKKTFIVTDTENRVEEMWVECEPLL